MTKSVTIYTTPTCGYCKATKEFFKENNIEHKEIDVAGDQAKAREMIERSGQMGVPVIFVGEGDEQEMVVGFDKAKLSELLGVHE